jgi:outer membrane protein assembly factor BamD
MRIPHPAWPRRRPALLRVAALCGLLSACSAAAPMPEGDLFREASMALEEESYATAISSYKKLLEEYPFSEKAEIATLNIAYAHYLNEEYAAAIAAFNDFERNYPVSPLLPFISYTIGMCWLDQAKDGQRDATASEEGLRQFQKVASEFPRTIYADMSVFRQRQCRENLAAHEIVVGDYYRDRGRLEAATARYRYVTERYPGTDNAARAARRLQEAQALASAAGDAKPALTPGQTDSEKPGSGAVDRPASIQEPPATGGPAPGF